MPRTISPRDVIPAMAGEAGITEYALSKRMGKTPNWAWNMKRNDTRLSTLTRIADELGQQVAILGKDGHALAAWTPKLKMISRTLGK